MKALRISAFAALLAMLAPATLAEPEGPLPFCEFEAFFEETFIQVSGGSKSWVIDTLVSFSVPDGVPVEFRSINPHWGYDEYSRFGDAKLSLFNDGTVYFRSHYPVTVGEQRVGVDQYLVSQGKSLILALEGEDDTGLTALAAMTHQIAGDNIDLFASAKAEQTAPLFARLEAGKPFKLLIGTEGLLIAQSSETTVSQYAEAAAYGQTELTRMQADAAAGLCM